MSTGARRFLNVRTVIKGGLLAAVVLLGWEVSARTGAVNSFLLPPPSRILTETLRGFIVPPFGVSKTLSYHVARSLVRGAIGWFAGSLVGAVVGVAMGWWPALDGLTSTLIELIRPVPAIVVLPVASVFLGVGDTPRILVIAWGCFVIVLINAVYGARAARDSLLVGVVRSFRGSPGQILRYATGPGALPQVVAGVGQAVGVAFIMIVASEMVLASDGIGWFTTYTRRVFSTPLMYGAIVTIAFLGWLASYLFSKLERVFLRRYGSA